VTIETQGRKLKTGHVALYATRPSWPMSLWSWALAAARGPVGLLL